MAAKRPGQPGYLYIDDPGLIESSLQARQIESALWRTSSDSGSRIRLLRSTSSLSFSSSRVPKI
ncbi:hypothetical protein [Faecalibaculum rodentium]|uniref:hypothetical protein n=1 Tax=Faecalibaculum rodentium TaxID=1702221 RepID=UPI0023F1A642|nr:hypothetical protein [Faecalibaculum rodentium]